MKKFVSLAVCLLTFLPVCVQAATIQCNENGIIVSEKAMIPNTEIPIILVRPEQKLSDLSDENYADIIAYAGTVYTDSGGRYQLNISLNGCEPGLYTLYGKDSEDSFYYADKKEKQNALTVFAGGNSKNIYEYLGDKNRFYSIFGEKVSVYDDYYEILSEEAKQKAAEKLCDFKLTSSIETISDINSQLSVFLSKFFVDCKAAFAEYGFSSLNKIITPENILEVLEQYSDIFSIDMTRLGTSDIYKTALYNALKNQNNLTSEKLRKICYEQAAVCEINALKSFNAGKIVDIINKNPDIFGDALSVSGFTSLTNTSKDKVLIKVAEKNDYKTAKEITDALTLCVKNADADTNKVTGGSSSGSSGGNKQESGKGSIQMGSNILPPNQNVQNTPPPNQSEISKEEQPFNDIENYDWANKAIKELYEKEIISGVGDNRFEPSRSISREEFLTMALRIFDVPLVENESEFSDVIKNSWYAKYVDTAKSIGIINGISDDEFGIGNPIIRQDASVILNNLLEHLKYEPLPEKEIQFSDWKDVSDYAADSVKNLYGGGIINGDEQMRFMPRKTLSRAEAAVMVYRILEVTDR